MNQFQIVSALMEAARSAVTATLGERAEVVWPAEFEPTMSRLLPTKFEETVSLVPIVKSERIIDEIGPENRIAFDAKLIEKSLVGVKGAATIAFPRSNDAPFVLYREDGEAHLVMPIRTGTVPAKPAKRKR